jgi:fructose-1,6-bisphosphatase-3
MKNDNRETANDLLYLRLLAKQFPSIQAASSEVINLSASLHLPKGTEHFLSDIHGEYEAFSHVMRSGSGSIKRKIDDLFATEMTAAERKSFATLIYYPRQKLSLVVPGLPDSETWFRQTLLNLIRLCRLVSSKYQRAALREALPDEFAFIIEELLNEQESTGNKTDYYNSIIATIISIGSAEAFVIALSELIQRLAIAHLHILGDIYDRSPGAHLIMDDLMDYHSIDVQWGNHDILWMGAAAGSEACIADVIRISLRYGNLETLEHGYAISLLPLASFALDAYGDDPCDQFRVKNLDEKIYTGSEMNLMARMHKAITIIQLKLEAQVIHRQPDYLMESRLLLEAVDYERGSAVLDGKEYPLLDRHFPTITPGATSELTEAEETVVEKLKQSFLNSPVLQRHVRFLLSRGSMYLIYNGNLLYHGCVPMNPDGSFYIYQEKRKCYSVREYMSRFDQLVRQGYLASDPAQKRAGLDTMWYLWSGQQSPLFGKSKMATFERYFIADSATHAESKNPYYDYRDSEDTVRRILLEYGLNPKTAHIINGHVPVKVSKGENPLKAGGKLLVIDGGFARAYQAQTGIAGYTLIYNSYGFLLVSHKPFSTTQQAIEEEIDTHPDTEILETNSNRIRVIDTDQGKQTQERIAELKALVSAYRNGLIKENSTEE